MALTRFKTETVVAPAFAACVADLVDAIHSSCGDALGGVAGSGVAVVAVGGGTHSEVGDPVVAPAAGARTLRAPSGIVVHDAADLTITVGAGTAVDEVNGVLSDAGQECPLDPRSPGATVGGTLASGLSGFRRILHGPLRDSVLEVRFVTGDGRLVQGGGPTVKNVSGYDLPRLLVGSLGTLGILVQATLRCRPLAPSVGWHFVEDHPTALLGSLSAPASLLWDGTRTHVLLEGHPDDVPSQVAVAGLRPSPGVPEWPSGPHRGRISVAPRALVGVGAALDAIFGCRWIGEVGVGTLHVACDTEEALAAARTAASSAGGWMLREAGAPGLSGFGREMPVAAVMGRVKRAFDPAGILSPGRIPL